MNTSLTRWLAGIVCLLLALPGFSQDEGKASYYADFFNGRKMANGDHYDPDLLTCAHRDLPFGSVLKVARKDNPDKSVMVIVTDRGPFVKGRIVDLSKAAASQLGILRRGVADVVLAVVKIPEEPYITGLGGGAQ